MRYIIEIMGDILNENTQKVLQFIQENPGCHMRWIKKDLNMSMGSVRYHLNVLEQAGRIISEKENLKKFYFPVGSFQTFERNLLKILNQDTAREIILFIIERKNPTQTDIVNSIKISHATANWHLTRLVSLGIVYEEKDGKFKKYLLRGPHDNLVNLLKNFHSSIWDRWSNRLAELFLSSTPSEGEK